MIACADWAFKVEAGCPAAAVESNAGKSISERIWASSVAKTPDSIRGTRQSMDCFAKARNDGSTKRLTAQQRQRLLAAIPLNENMVVIVSRDDIGADTRLAEPG